MKGKIISFIGAGNMAQAIIAGLLTMKYSANQLWASNPSVAKMKKIAQHGVQVTSHNTEAAEIADVVVLAVKPQKMKTVCQEIQPALLKKKPLIVSVAAGISTTLLKQWLPGLSVIRVMPNITATVNAGATALFAGDDVDECQRSIAEAIFLAVGMAVWVDDEAQLDVVTAVSGAGPAYIFLILEAIQAAAVELGLPESTARALTAEMCFGAAKMVLELDESLVDLRNAVTSPNGTTIKALEVFMEANLPLIIRKAVKAACMRAQELARLD